MFIAELPALHYQMNELDPYLSQDAVDTHYNKHHQTYVNNLNKFIKDTKYEKMSSLEEIVVESHKAGDTAIFNNSAQILNHNMYWLSMQPKGGSEGGSTPSAALNDSIVASFGSVDEMTTQMKQAAVSQFGSGWAFLVLNNKTKKLEIIKTSNAETPILNDATPLLTLDVWEHAYYIDYKNLRPVYVDKFFTNLANWGYASKQFESASK